MRTAAEQVAFEYTRFTGASKPGTQTLVAVGGGVGEGEEGWGVLEDAADVPASGLGQVGVGAFTEEQGWPPFQRLWCTCMPEPLSLKTGLGMNVAVLPYCLATLRTTYLYVITLSAA